MGWLKERGCILSGQFVDLVSSIGGGHSPVQQRGYPTSRLTTTPTPKTPLRERFYFVVRVLCALCARRTFQDAGSPIDGGKVRSRFLLVSL